MRTEKGRKIMLVGIDQLLCMLKFCADVVTFYLVVIFGIVCQEDL